MLLKQKERIVLAFLKKCILLFIIFIKKIKNYYLEELLIIVQI